MLSHFMSTPTLVKVLCSLGVILIVSQLSRQLLLSIVVGTLTLALWTGHSPASICMITLNRIASTNTIMLLLVVFQVMWLSNQMAQAGMMKELVDAVRERVSHRASLAVLPAVIGLLPMPGGAIFSAPLVDSCDVDGSIPPNLKACINHWFRHMWEYWWPLYPGVLLALDICHIPLWQFVAIQLPLTVAYVVAGYFFLLRKTPRGRETIERTRNRPTTRLLPLVMPILVIVATYALVTAGYAGVRAVWAAARMNSYVPMSIGILLAMVALQRHHPLTGPQWRKILLSSRAVIFAGIVLAVLVYGGFIAAKLPDGTPVVEQMRLEMHQWGIPMTAAVMVLPFVCGLTTGITVGYVGASFPILINLLGPNPPLSRLFATIVLAYGVGHMGMMLSPVHICLVVTSEHFKTRLIRSIVGLLKPAVCMVCVAIALSYLLGSGIIF